MTTPRDGYSIFSKYDNPHEARGNTGITGKIEVLSVLPFALFSSSTVGIHTIQVTDAMITAYTEVIGYEARASKAGDAEMVKRQSVTILMRKRTASAERRGQADTLELEASKSFLSKEWMTSDTCEKDDNFSPDPSSR